MEKIFCQDIEDSEFARLDDSEKDSEFVAVESKTYFQDAWGRFKKNKLALVSLVFMAAVILFAVFAPMFSPYTYDGQDLTCRNALPNADKFGRDIFVRIMYGARISLSVGFAAALLNLVIGVAYGAICGYFGGKVDMILMRLVDIIYSVPTLLYVILIMLIFAGASIYTAETKTMHQNELDSILGAAMEESMEILTVNPTYSIGKEVEGKELAADFIQNMLMRTTSKSTFEVEILTADAQKGLLDVRVTEYYRQIWGTGKAVARKTVILDDVEGKEEVFSKISFWKSYKDNKGEEKRIVKQVVVPEGILLPKEILPVENESGDEKVKGWRAVGQSENTIYTKENIGTVQAKGDMDFEAVYEKTGSKAD